MNRPLVTIDLAPHLSDFLYHEFKQDKRTGELLLDGSNDIGRFIQALITVSDRPRKQEIKDSPLTLTLPVQEWTHAIFTENFIYIPEWKQKQLRLYVEAQFRLRLREFFFIGYLKGLKQDAIINAFLEHYNIKNNALNYDTVKKYDYRFRRKMKTVIGEDIASLCS